mmetsp:Transcript_7119/g.7462  ORF Transcript_7119/g.7462 Transcript_7119/m.7462 type:complete len:106 (-) Transcript_7119:391-708(-)
MYKVELYYQSQFKGIYTKEEETTNIVGHIALIKLRMLQRWALLLCPIIPTKVLQEGDLEKVIEQQILMYNICDKVDETSSMRSFKITVSEVKEDEGYSSDDELSI